jgi:uncharacterized protein YbjT (DUF2867 family)
MSDDDRERILLTGATGFVGNRLYPALEERGYDVVCASRRPERARANHPDREWVELDVERPETIADAAEGCNAAYYLIHQITSGPDYQERERRSSRYFRDAVDAAELERVVYLGGVEPAGGTSEHLESRLETGRILRGRDLSTVELRAAMIIGRGSASWQIVRDLAARLPAMVLPAWTQTRSQPVWIGDVVVALVMALELDLDGSDWFNIPGPETLTVEEVLADTAAVLGNDPWMLDVPFVTPRLSSYWLRFVTRADTKLARELVEGLKFDLITEKKILWDDIDHAPLTSFAEAVRREAASPDRMSARLVERAVRAVAPAAKPSDRGTAG